MATVVADNIAKALTAAVSILNIGSLNTVSVLGSSVGTPLTANVNVGHDVCPFFPRI